MEIWFNPLTWNINPSGKGLEYVEHDFPAFVRSDAAWRKSSSRVGVLFLSGNVIWSYPDLPGLVAFARNHQWSFGLSFGMEFDAGRCPRQLEGISQDSDANREAVKIAQIWHRAGGKLDYISMDSPLFFAHYADKECNVSIEEAAKRAAVTLKGILREYPNVRIVDAEGPGRVPNDVWFPDMTEWFAAFQRASGRSINAVALDLHWTDLRPDNDWHDTARRAAKFFHKHGILAGLLINATPTLEQNDMDWMEANRRHIEEAVDSNLNLDFIEIVQWQHHVKRNLPESDPGAYTSLVNFAFNLISAFESH